MQTYFFFFGSANTIYLLGTSVSFFDLSVTLPVAQTTRYCWPLFSYIAGIPSGTLSNFVDHNRLPLSSSNAYIPPSTQVANTIPVDVMIIPFPCMPLGI